MYVIVVRQSDTKQPYKAIGPFDEPQDALDFAENHFDPELFIVLVVDQPPKTTRKSK
jgi:hypothetical protein